MKIAIINDTHFGARNDNAHFNEYFYQFYEFIHAHMYCVLLAWWLRKMIQNIDQFCGPKICASCSITGFPVPVFAFASDPAGPDPWKMWPGLFA